MRYKVILRKGGARLYQNFEDMVTELQNGNISMDMSDGIIIPLHRNDELLGVALQMHESFRW